MPTHLWFSQEVPRTLPPHAMDGKTLQFYSEQAPTVAARYAAAERSAARHFQVVFGTGGRILDVGCGSGRDLQALVEAGFDAEGVDACSALLTEVKRRYPALADRIRRDTLPELGTVPDGSIDGILCWAVLMHLPVDRLFDTLFNLRRVLRPGGRLLISTPLQGPPVDSATHRDVDGRLFNGVPPEQFQFLFEKVGFSADPSLGFRGTLSAARIAPGRRRRLFWKGRVPAVWKRSRLS
jgi:2-polyprenyl-3-methyl-5-hydroxy-6-metoxy-1,4-benzoquinol methylase